MGLPITSPDISNLDFSILWDISGVPPTITLTNTSTVIHANNLKWWFVLTTPSGIFIHQGVQTSPDVNQVAWTTYVVPNVWPTPFGNPPCGQVEFSSTVPYSCTVFVQDSTTAIFSLTKTAVIVRPNGNTDNTCGNFGRAMVSMKVDCWGKSINCFDSTNITYNNIITPVTIPTSVWTLVYPQDLNGNNPANGTASNTPNVSFPISINSKGYTIYFQEYARYDYGNGVSVKVQYKLFDASGNVGMTFQVACNTNLCKLQCQMQKFYKLSKSTCGTLELASLTNKMVRLNWLYAEILTGIFQPLCGIDIDALMEEMKRVGQFDDNCDCGCGCQDGLGFSNPTGTNSASGCCPSFVNVIDKNTGIQPVSCSSGGYFPADVYDPTGTNVISTATDMTSLISILNGNGLWQAYGIAFDIGNCQVGFYPANAGTIIPVVKVISTGGGGGGKMPPTQIQIKVNIHGTSSLPASCPASYFPVRVYDPTDTTIIGIANTVTDIIAILNAYSAWSTYGVASPIDNCTIQYNLTNAANVPPNVHVDQNTTSSGCVNGTQLYVVDMADVCQPTLPISAASFPCNVSVNFGSGPVNLGSVANNAALVTALNAATGKPSVITFAATTTVGVYQVTNSNCTIYSGTITITCDAGSDSFLIYGPNHTNMTGVAPTVNGEYAVGMRTSLQLGRIPGVTNNKIMWHSIQLGNFLLTTESNTGKIFIYDISTPLTPTLARTIQLTTVVGNNFAGTPHSITLFSAGVPILSAYSLYFPTDYQAGMTINNFYVVEAVTGTLWKCNASVATGVVASLQDDQLIGKCPRVFVNNKIYFSQDGDLEQATSQSSGIAEGLIVVFNTTTMTITSTPTIFQNVTEYVWAASYDGVGTIYFSGDKGSVATYDVIADAVLSRYLGIRGISFQYGYRLNSCYFLGKLYWTPITPGIPLASFVDVTTLGTTNVITDFQACIAPDNSPTLASNSHNFKPLGNCLGILTIEDYSNNGLGFLAVYKLDGTFVETIRCRNLDAYNIIPVPNVSIYTPNSFV